VTPIVVLDASAAAEMFAQTTHGRALLRLAPPDRRWWVPDHFYIETAGAIRRMLHRGIVDAPLLTADRKLASAPNLPIRVLHLSVAE
jgi:predicted nucleic acid-binding protein